MRSLSLACLCADCMVVGRGIDIDERRGTIRICTWLDDGMYLMVPGVHIFACFLDCTQP